MLSSVILMVTLVMVNGFNVRIEHPRYDPKDVPSVRLFEHRNFAGGVLSMSNVIGCTNFDHTYFNDKASSIDTRGHCFYLYEDAHCQGRNARVDRNSAGQADLSELGFNDNASSLRSC
ncbi:hypothetical protein HDE_09198 [Halotydeus destructor]|nr:hypothetical protein HDE_09198 [Halotydeus destructor]